MSEKNALEAIRPNQLAAIAALVNGSNKREAAAAADVTSRTLRRWQHETLFQAALSEAQRQRMRELSLLSFGPVQQAIERCQQILGDAQADYKDWMAAGRLAMQIYEPLYEQTVADDAIQAIEARLEQAGL